MRTAPTPAESTLAAMRTATRALHAKAERSGFVAELLAGRATRTGYALWLRNLWLAYDALEAGLRRSSLDGLVEPRVFRAAAIAADLEAMCGAGWRDVPVLRAAHEYVRHIEHAAGGSGAGLLAHAYVRYLGDLNGGRVLRRIVARAPGLDAGALNFYAYATEPAALEVAYREALAAAGRVVNDDEAAAAAAAEAFGFNIALSEAVLAADA